jgi:hypothetical protein
MEHMAFAALRMYRFHKNRYSNIKKEEHLFKDKRESSFYLCAWQIHADRLLMRGIFYHLLDILEYSCEAFCLDRV